MKCKQYSATGWALLFLVGMFGGMANAHAYSKARITNNTEYTVTGKVNYVLCSSDAYSVAPGGTWTATTDRGICLISSIDGNANGSSINGEPTGIAAYDPDISTGYSRFQIEGYNGGRDTGYRIYSETEFAKETAGSSKSPGFYFVNKTDWPIAFRISQVGCLYHGVVPVGGSIRRSTGAVWFQLDFNIQPDGVDPVNVGEDCILPVVEFVADVGLAALSGGSAGAAGAALKAVSKTAIKAGVKAAIKKGAKAGAKIVVQNAFADVFSRFGSVSMFGQYAGYDSPFRCNQQPEYWITGGPQLTLDAFGSLLVANGVKIFGVKKVNDCGENMMAFSSTEGYATESSPFTTGALLASARSLASSYSGETITEADLGLVIESVEQFEPSNIVSWPPPRKDSTEPYAYPDSVERAGGETPMQIDAGYNGDVWMLGSNQQDTSLNAITYKWNKETQKWDNKLGLAVRIAVDPIGNAWVINANGIVYEWSPRVNNPNGGVWEQRGSKTFSDIEIGREGSVWALEGLPQSNSASVQERALWKWEEGNWITVSEAFNGNINDMEGWRLAVDPFGNPWVADDNGNILVANYDGPSQRQDRAVDLENEFGGGNLVLDIDIGFNETDPNNKKIEVYYTYQSCQNQNCNIYARTHTVAIGAAVSASKFDLLENVQVANFEFKPSNIGFDQNGPAEEVTELTQMTSAGNGKFWFTSMKSVGFGGSFNSLFTNDASNYIRESIISIDPTEILVGEESNSEYEVFINLTRTGALRRISVPILVSGSAESSLNNTQNADYSFPIPYIIFEEGATSAEFSLKILDDNLYEPGSPETLLLEVGSKTPIYGTQVLPDQVNNSKMIRILDANWPKPTQSPLQVPMNASQVDVGTDGSVWILGTEPYATGSNDLKIYVWERELSETVRQQFVQKPGGARKIAVSPEGNAWVVNSVGSAWEWKNNVFESRGNIGATDIDVGADGSVIAVVDSGTRLKKWNGSTWDYLMPTSAGFTYQGFTVSSDGTPYVTQGNGRYCRVFNLNSSDRSWGCANADVWEMDTGADFLQYVTRETVGATERAIWSRQQPNGDYRKLEGSAKQLASSGRDAYWFINAKNELWTTDTYNFWNVSESVVSPPITIPLSERQALESIYAATGGTNWTNNTSWLGEAGTECDWYGVTCNDGSVVALDLSNNELAGSIPLSLQNLTSLTDLDISDNSLDGSVPSWLLDLNLSNFQYTNAFMALPIMLGSQVSYENGFKFTIENIEGNIPGKISGVIRGLVDNQMDQTATSVTLTSWPDGLLGERANTELTTWSSQAINSFDVVDGVVVSASFFAQDSSADFSSFVMNAGLVTNCCGTLNNGLSFDNNNTLVGNNGGFDGVSIARLLPPFKFSFENVEGNVSGAISGEIRGLVDNESNQSASSVTLTSWPDDLLGEPANKELTTWSSQGINSFDVSDGMVVGASFGVQDSSAGFSTFVMNAGLQSNCCGTLTNALLFDNGITIAGNSDGFDGISFARLLPPFKFSFTNVQGNISGAVSGEIRGLVDNESSQSASSVTLTSWPNDLLGEPANKELTTWSSQGINSFDVSDGMVVGASFGVQDSSAGFSTFVMNAGLQSNCCGTLTNALLFDNGITIAGNSDGFDGISFARLLPPFKFSFSNIDGNVDGTIQGVIAGLVANTNDQSARSVLITSWPSSLTGNIPDNLDAVNWLDQSNNSFSVDSEKIVGISFFGLEPGYGLSLNIEVLNFCCGVLNNYLTFDNSNNSTGNSSGFDAISISSLLSAWKPQAIIDTLQRGQIVFSTDEVTVKETDGTVQIAVTRQEGSEGTVSVTYLLNSGSAIVGADADASGGTLEWLDGDSDDQFINISLINDNETETLESLVLTLSANNANLLGTQSTLNIVIRDDESNQAPTATAGEDSEINTSQSVTLAGSGTDPEDQPLSYQWQQISGSNVTINNANSLQASFSAPSAAGVLEFSLIITDDFGLTISDNIVITVIASTTNTPPPSSSGGESGSGGGSAYGLLLLSLLCLGIRRKTVEKYSSQTQ